MIDLAKLRTLAESAPAGPWSASAASGNIEAQVWGRDGNALVFCDDDIPPNGQAATDLCAYIAAVDPCTLLNLLDQHARATALLRRIVNGPRPTYGPLDLYDEIAAFLRETDNG